MSEWSERFEKSPVWEHLRAVGARIDEAQAVEDASPDAIEGLERLRVVLTYVGKRLASADPLLVLGAHVDSIAGAFSGIANELQAFVDDENPEHVRTANGQADSALNTITSIINPTLPVELEGLGSAATAYRELLKSQLEEAKKVAAGHRAQAASLTEQLTLVQAELNAVKQRAESVVSEFQAQFSQAQDARGKTFEEMQAGRQDRFDKFFGEAQDGFSKTQTAWGQEHNAAQLERQQKFDALVAEHSKRLAERATEYEKQAETTKSEHDAVLAALNAEFKVSASKLVAEMEADRDYVKKLLGVIGNDGVTTGYQQTADEAHERARLWQLVAVGSMVVLIAIAMFVFFTATGEFRLAEVGGRLFVAIALGILAAYAARQADKYVEAERRNRKQALELQAIGPYLAPLPEEEQNAFRVALGNRTFGKDEPALHAKPSPANGLDLLKQKDLRELLAELAKFVRPGDK
jgi:hypothetical protein